MNPHITGFKLRACALLILFTLFVGVAPARAEAPTPVIGEPASSDSPGYQPSFAGCSRVNVPVQNAAYEQQVLDLVNQERANVDAPPLKRNTDLDYASRYYANDMQTDNYFGVKDHEHDTFDRSGSTLTFVCDTWTRYGLFFTAGWKGENIAGGQTTPQQVMDAWMNSDGHRENILRTSFREIGVGYFYGSNGYRSYWVQDFGARNAVYPLIINSDAAQTGNPNVNLYIYAPAGATQMRLRNDSDAWGAWQDYKPTIDWTLKLLNGTRTVSVEVRSGSSTYASSDTIEIVNLGPVLGNLPDALTFIYDQSQATMIPAQVSLNPLNVGSADVLNWQANLAAGAGINAQSGSGSTPGSSFTFSPTGAALNAPGTHTTTLTVNVTNFPAGAGLSKTIQVKLIVVDALDNTLFLSSIQK